MSINKVLLTGSILGIVVCVVYLLYVFFVETPIQLVKTRQDVVNDNIKKLKDGYISLEREQVNDRVVALQDPPEVNRLKTLLEDLKTDRSWSSMIAMADIYRKGAYPRFLPNENLAIELYRTVSMCPNGEIAATAQLKYMETRKEIITNDDRAGKPLPTYYGEEAIMKATILIKQTPIGSFEKPHFKTIKTPPVAVEAPTSVFDFEPNFDLEALFERRPTADLVAYKSDSQNVHDHSVVQTTKENIKRLQSNISTTNGDKSVDTTEAITDTILSVSDLSEKQRLNALEVLEKLSTNKHSTLDISERGALDLVWKKIASTSDHTLKENLKETLSKQLSSAYENGYVVCSTGKIARILGTLDGVESINTSPIKPMWVIKEEIGNMASKVREDHLSKMSTQEQNNYDSQKANDMKLEFENQAKSLYVKELGMKESIISPIIDLYAEGF